MSAPTVIPHLNVQGGEAAIAFYEKAFDAKLDRKMMAQDGKRVMNASLSINGGMVMLQDEFPEYAEFDGSKSPTTLGGSAVTIHLEVPDADAAYDKAIAAGATKIMAPDNMFWGARYAQVKDPFGHLWSIGGPLKT
jgi:PhnB protein